MSLMGKDEVSGRCLHFNAVIVGLPRCNKMDSGESSLFK